MAGEHGGKRTGDFRPAVIAFFLLMTTPLLAFSVELIYTIQIGSHLVEEASRRHYDSVLEMLPEAERDSLRIEKIDKYYALRIGNFKSFAATDDLYKTIAAAYPDARRMTAYISANRLIAIYSPEKEETPAPAAPEQITESEAIPAEESNQPQLTGALPGAAAPIDAGTLAADPPLTDDPGAVDAAPEAVAVKDQAQRETGSPELAALPAPAAPELKAETAAIPTEESDQPQLTDALPGAAATIDAGTLAADPPLTDDPGAMDAAPEAVVVKDQAQREAGSPELATLPAPAASEQTTESAAISAEESDQLQLTDARPAAATAPDVARTLAADPPLTDDPGAVDTAPEAAIEENQAQREDENPELAALPAPAAPEEKAEPVAISAEQSDQPQQPAARPADAAATTIDQAPEATRQPAATNPASEGKGITAVANDQQSVTSSRMLIVFSIAAFILMIAYFLRAQARRGIVSESGPTVDTEPDPSDAAAGELIEPQADQPTDNLMAAPTEDMHESSGVTVAATLEMGAAAVEALEEPPQDTVEVISSADRPQIPEVARVEFAEPVNRKKPKTTEPTEAASTAASGAASTIDAEEIFGTEERCVKKKKDTRVGSAMEAMIFGKEDRKR